MLFAEPAHQANMADLANIDNIEDEDILESLVNQTEDLELRRKIRRRQRNLREKRTAQWEAERKARADVEDALTARLRRAEEEKQRKLREFEEQARQNKEQLGAAEEALRQRQANAEQERQKRLQQLSEMHKVMSTTYNVGVNDILQENKVSAEAPESSQVASVNFGAAPVRRAASVQVRGGVGFGGTAYGVKPAAPAAANKPNVGGPAGNQSNIQRNPSAIKQMLLDWCKAQCAGYENVNITNFSSSWSDGLAFCALIHHFYPEAFDFSKLNPKNRRGNFTLAFEKAEKLADIAPLLDVEDMVRMKTPDWKCVFTYVQSFYRRFAMQPKSEQNAQ